MDGRKSGRSAAGPRAIASWQAGFSLVEVCITLTVSVVLLFALHTSTQSSIMTRRSAEKEYQLHLMAIEFVSRLRRVPFGAATDLAASSAQLTDLFDDDDDLGSVTLSQLVHPPLGSGHTFTMATKDFAGTWSVRVTRDLNGDGDLLDERENRSDLLRLTLYFENRRILDTIRAAEPSATILDVGVNYLGGG